jgi:hypothetical protein
MTATDALPGFKAETDRKNPAEVDLNPVVT